MSDLNTFIETAHKIEQARQKARKPTYYDYLPEDGNFTEEDLWEAIAEANGLDVDEIMDGDLVEWL
jgi:hypothetical protein